MGSNMQPLETSATVRPALHSSVCLDVNVVQEQQHMEQQLGMFYEEASGLQDPEIRSRLRM
jgi:hypothetical protein